MTVADDLGRQDRRRRRQRVDRRVDPERSDLPAQLGRGVEVRERRERRRVRVVVGRHVHRLQRRDRVALRRRDALLELAHLVGQRRLVAHRRGHPPEQRRHLRARLHEPEDVVDEQEHVLVLHVAEVLGDGQRGQPDAEADTGRLVHLPEDQRRFVDHTGLLHFDPEVGALACALADSREHRHAAVLRGDTVDHLEDDDRLAHSGTAEHADLAAADVRLEQVDHLDAGLEHLAAWLELAERGRLSVDVPVVVDLRQLVGGDVERLPEHVEHVAEDAVPDRHLQAVTEVAHLRAPAETVGGLHADGPHPVVADLLGDLGDDANGLALELDLHLDGVVDLRQSVGRELDVDDRAGDGDDAPVLQLGAGALLGGHGHREYSFAFSGLTLRTRARAGPRRTAPPRPVRRGGGPRRHRRSR